MIGERLAEARRRGGLRWIDLAVVLDKSSGYMSQVENATAEQIGGEFSWATPEQAEHILNGSEPDYHRVGCGRLVSYPETLYNDYRCQKCHEAVDR